VAPPGNQAETEKTNLNLKRPECPAYSPKAPVKRKNFSYARKFVFLVDAERWVTDIFTFAEISFSFRLQPSLHQSPIRIKVMNGKRL
jgi:hypothetical protein